MKNTASASGASKTRGFTAILAAMAIISMALIGTTTEAAQQQDAADNTGGLGFEAQTSAVFANSTNNANAAVFNANRGIEVGINGLIANEHVSTVQVVSGDKSVTFTNGVGFGNQVDVNTANNGATLTKTGEAFNDTGNVVTVGNSGTTTNTHTATGATHHGTLVERASNNDATEVFGGTGQVRILGS